MKIDELLKRLEVLVSLCCYIFAMRMVCPYMLVLVSLCCYSAILDVAEYRFKVLVSLCCYRDPNSDKRAVVTVF